MRKKKLAGIIWMIYAILLPLAGAELSEMMFPVVPQRSVRVAQSNAVTSNHTWGGAQDDEAWGMIKNSSHYISVGRTKSFGAGLYDVALVAWDLAGNVVWNRTWGWTGGDEAWDIVSNGSHYITIGSTNNFGLGGYDFTLIVWDLAGNVVWNRTWGWMGEETGSRIVINATHYITVGNTDSFGMGGIDTTLVAWDLAGNVVWNRTWGGIGMDWPKGLVTNGTHYITTGYTTSYGAGDNDYFLVAWDLAGNVVWNRTWGGIASDVPNNIFRNATHYIIAGSTRNFGAVLSDSVLVAWDLAGNVVWNRTRAGSGMEVERAIVLQQNQYVTAGHSNSSGAGDRDQAITVWDLAGNVVWNNTWGGILADESTAVVNNGTHTIILGYCRSFGKGLYDFTLVIWETGKPVIDDTDDLWFWFILIGVIVAATCVTLYLVLKRRRPQQQTKT